MSDHPAVLGGTCNARFDPLRELFAAKLEAADGYLLRNKPIRRGWLSSSTTREKAVAE